MKRICVFLGSHHGTDGRYVETARALGRELTKRGLQAVFGGTSAGTMAVLADSVLEAGGKVVGVIPRVIHEKGLSHPGLTELHVVETMHERKAKMNELSDGFIALPGGMGTMEEFFEVLAWAQLGFHYKPCGLLSVGGFYSHLEKMLDHMVDQGFIKPEYRAMVLVADNPADMINQIFGYVPPRNGKWLDQPEPY